MKNINVKDLYALRGWLTAAALGLHVPALIIRGQQATGKTTLLKVLTNSLADANNNRRPPLVLNDLSHVRPNDVVRCANDQGYLAFDGVRMTANAPDILAGLITGGVLQTRKLHTNDEQGMVEMPRVPVMLTINAGDLIVMAADLNARAILIDLEPIEQFESQENVREMWTSLIELMVTA